MERVNQQVTEELIAEWTEPQVIEPASKRTAAAIMTGAIILAILMGIIGYFTSDSTFYFGLVACLIGGFSISFQKRRPQPPLPISLTTARIQVGTKTYPLEEMAGYWLQQDGEYIIINIEPSKPSMFPISFHYPNPSEDEAHNLVSSILPEVEPRSTGLTESINKYIKF